VNDFHLAWRSLSKERSFTLLAVLVLTLGIGGVVTQFSVLNGLLLRLPAFAHAGQLVTVDLVDTVRGQPAGGLSTADYLDWSATQQSCQELALYAARVSLNVTHELIPRRYGGVYVTENFFRTLGVTPLLGRDFTAADNQPGAAKVIIINHRLWQTDFGAAPDIVGRKVHLNGRPGTIIGVMPPDFTFAFSEQVWAPLFQEFPARPRGDPEGWGGTVLGRLKPGVSREQAAAEFTAAARRGALEFPATNRNFTAAQVVPLAESFLRPQLRQVLVVMFAAVVIVLLIACVNVMNMQFARAARRTRDLAVCSALGASRGRLLRQMLVENLVLAAGGAAGGTLFAWWATGALLRQARSIPTPPPAWVTFDLDGRALFVICLIAAGTGLLAGLAPAWLASRSRLTDVLREGGRSTNRRVNRVIRSLVVLQIALTAALLVVSSFMVRSIVNQQRIDWGYDTGAVLAARMTLFQADHPTPEALGRFYDRTLQALRTDPRFERIALTTRFRLAVSQSGPCEIEGATYADQDTRPLAAIEPISDGYFTALDMQIPAGRDFAPTDRLDAPPVAMVNTAFARRHFGLDSPLGRRIRLVPGGRPGRWLTIVGVAPDTHMQGPSDGRSDGAGIFLPLWQSPQRWITLVVRGRGGAAAAWAGPLRQAMARLDPNLPIYQANTAAELIGGAMAQGRLLAVMFSLFGGVAMLLASIGLYGVMSFAVSQRTHEYGIRMALGADRRRILGMILRQGAGQLVLGLGLGLSLALALVSLGGAFMEGFLYQVSRADPLVWGSTIALLGAVALLACLAPGHRAARINPVEALRAD
jgi:putative ABC transport system permease protein